MVVHIAEKRVPTGTPLALYGNPWTSKSTVECLNGFRETMGRSSVIEKLAITYDEDADELAG